MTGNVDTDRELVVDIGCRLLEEGLTKGTGGNVSVRNGDRVIVTPSGIPYEQIEPEDVPVVSVGGNQIKGEYPPSSETPMHTAIYRERDDVGAIVHTHSPFASTFAALGQPIEPSHYLIAVAGHDIPVAEYAPPGTEELGSLATEALGDESNACLLEHHGVVAVGDDEETAFNTALIVEFCARIHFQASVLGDPPLLSEEELDELVEIFESYRGTA
jgi:L-fuculose-phosphate aldolase